MTITINPFEILRFLFIVGWILVAGLTTMSSMFVVHDREDWIFMLIVWILCGGSAAMLYFGTSCAS